MLTRALPLLPLLLTLTACPAGSDPLSQAPSSPDGATAPADSSESTPHPLLPTTPPVPRAVVIEVPRVPAAKEVTVALLGFAPSQMAGGWSKKGEIPIHHVKGSPMAPSERMEVELDLHPGLTYIAVLDLDGYGIPEPGELTSLPLVIPTEEGAAVPPFLLDRPYGDDAVKGGEGAASSPSEGEAATTGLSRKLIVDTAIKPPFLKRGRILVIAQPSREDGSYVSALSGTTSFTWLSDTVELDWPVELDAQVPAEGDLQVLLDLDGGGEPTTGDLASEPTLAFVPPADGEAIKVKLVKPLTEEGEGGE